MTKETLFTLAILEGATSYRKLPKFLKDNIDWYLTTTGQSLNEAISNLKN